MECRACDTPVQLEMLRAFLRPAPYLRFMLELQQIDEIATQVARRRLPRRDFQRVTTEPTTDSLGEEALHITIVLGDDAIRQLTGDEVLDLLVELQDKLQAEGDERLPLVRYSTEHEMAVDNSEGYELGGPEL
jgi:hypothetical protein